MAKLRDGTMLLSLAHLWLMLATNMVKNERTDSSVAYCFITLYPISIYITCVKGKEVLCSPVS